MADYEQFKPEDYMASYKKAAAQQKGAYDILFKANQQQTQAQIPNINKAYDTARGGTYAGARVSALGNNEALANMGLAGNAYTAPKSGYSETSRVYQDVALQNRLNSLSAEQRTAIQTLQQQMQMAQQQRMSDFANIDSQVTQQGANLELQGEQINYSRKQQAEAQMKQEDQAKVDYFAKLMENGGNLSDDQKALWQKYTGTTVDQYKQVANPYLYKIEQVTKDPTLNENVKTLINNINGGSNSNPTIANQLPATLQVLQSLSTADIATQDIDTVLNTFGISPNAFSESIFEINDVLAMSDNPQDRAMFEKMFTGEGLKKIQEWAASKGIELDIVEDDQVIDGGTIPENETRPTATTSGKAITSWNAIGFKNVNIKMGENSYVIEFAPQVALSTKTKKAVLATGIKPGEVALYDNDIYLLATDGKIRKMKATKKNATDYENLKTALTR